MENGRTDILDQLFKSIPPDSEGMPKVAASAVESLIHDTLGSFDDEEETLDKRSSKSEEKEVVEDSALTPEEGDAGIVEAVPEASKIASPNEEAYYRALQTYLSDDGVDTGRDDALRKEAARQFLEGQDELVKVAVAEAQRLTFGGEIMASAFSDELAKIAMAEAQGVDFETYLEHNMVGLEDIPVE